MYDPVKTTSKEYHQNFPLFSIVFGCVTATDACFKSQQFAASVAVHKYRFLDWEG
jgi:hypothetical protein